jgi:hypothetical protein
MAFVLGLGVDESLRGRAVAPAAGYFDHPPLSFWIPHSSRGSPGGASGVVAVALRAALRGDAFLLYRLTAAYGERADSSLP